MDIGTHFVNMLKYEIQANADTLQQLRAAKGNPGEAVFRFAHVQAVRDLWLRRVRREPTTGFDPFPQWSLEKSEAVMRDMDRAWTECLQDIDERRLEEPLLWEDTSGGFWSARVYDAIVQALNHSIHHRGQIALLLRQNGDEPMRIDYVLYHRESEEG